MESSNSYAHDQGVVVKKNIGSCIVRSSDRILLCAISTRLRKDLKYPTADPNSLRPVVRQVKTLDHVDPLAVGDMVRFIEVDDGSGLITKVLPRRNRLVRRDPGSRGYKFEQVVVANVDHLIFVFAAANPKPKWGLLDRYLVAAESLDIAAYLVITKMDLVRDWNGKIADDLGTAITDYRRVGYPILLTSAVSGEGLVELRQMLKGGVSAFVGKSGVGKSALLNALEPGLAQRVGPVGNGREGKGRHTTTSAEMFRTSFEADIVDTPGMREFGLPNINGNYLAEFFPEMRQLLGSCKFGLGCRHDEEPGCAIRKAVMAGKISPQRYRSYLRLNEELQDERL